MHERSGVLPEAGQPADAGQSVVMELSPEEIARAMRVVDQIKAQSKGIRRLSRKLEECSRNYAKACFELDLSRNETARVQQTLRQLLADISTLREQVRAAGAEPRV